MGEDLSLFLADFAVDATLAGNGLRALLDTESVLELGGSITQAPSALVMSSAAPAAAPGQTFVANAVTYKVRQVLREPPDGAFTRLVLTR